jgi:hypothetical protein
MATRCCSPPESSCGLRFSRPPAHEVQNVRDSVLDYLFRGAHNAHCKSHIVVHRHVVYQTEVLKHNADSPSHFRDLAPFDAAHVETVDGYLALGGLDLPGEKLYDRGLAGAGRPHQKDELSLVDGHVHILQGRGAAAFIHHRNAVHLNH